MLRIGLAFYRESIWIFGYLVSYFNDTILAYVVIIIINKGTL